MLVSVVITTYNRDFKVLQRALESVKQQTYKQIEIIVVNDTPTSNPLFKEVGESIEEEYGKQIKYIASGKNNGACYARNLGVDVSKGDYIAFLDDDDTWENQKIEKQVEILNNTSFPMVSVGYRTIYVDENGFYKKPYRYGRNKIINLVQILNKNVIGGTSAPLIRREAFIKAGGFDNNMPAAQDYDLWIRLAQLGDVYFINEPLQNYYVYKGERISNDPSKKIIGYNNLIKKYKHLIPNNKAFLVNKHVVIAFHEYRLNDNNANSSYKIALKNLIPTKTFVYYSIRILLFKLKKFK